MIKPLALSFLCIICSGCAVDGILYTKKIMPYSSEFNKTPVGLKTCKIDNFRVKEPFSGLGVSAEWMNSTIRQQAKNNGINNIYFADLEVTSFLLGIYTQKSLLVYGD